MLPGMMRRTLLATLLAWGLSTGCHRQQAAPHQLVIGLASSGVTFDPHLHDEESGYSTLAHFYNTLVGFSPDMELLPELAISWQNPTETLWRFQLRPNVFFHDGQPFEAEDAAASIRRAMRIPGSKVAYYLQAVETARAVDAHTLEVVTRFPTPVLLNKLVFIGIVPRGMENHPISEPVGTGPYVFTSGHPGKDVEGKRNPRYWGRQPAFPLVKIVPFPDEQERTSAVSRGLADLAGRLAEDTWAWGKSLPNSRMEVHEGLGVTMLGFSLRPGTPCADLRVRQAISAVINRARLVPPERKGLVIPMAALVPPSVFGHVSTSPARPPDPARAHQLLFEAGFKNGLTLPVLFSGSSRALADALAPQLKSAGVELQPEALSWPDFYRKLSEGKVTAVLFNFTASTGDISDVLDAVFHSPGSGFGAFNFSGAPNPSLDRLIEESNRNMDPYTRLESISKAVAEIEREVRVIPLVVRASHYAIRPGLEWTPRRDRRIRAIDVVPGDSNR